MMNNSLTFGVLYISSLMFLLMEIKNANLIHLVAVAVVVACIAMLVGAVINSIFYQAFHARHSSVMWGSMALGACATFAYYQSIWSLVVGFFA